MLNESISKLIKYGIETGLLPECEKIYATNLLLDLFCEESYVEPEQTKEHVDLENVLADLLDEAVKRGLIEDSIAYRDLFDTKVMNCLVPRPAQVQREFWEAYETSPETATKYFYKLSQDSDYIRRYRVKKDKKWTVESPYGTIDTSRRKIRKPLRRQRTQRQQHIQNVSSAWKMKGMPGDWIIRPERITGLFHLRSMEQNGDSSTHRMFITMNTVLYSTENTSR